MSDGPDGVRLKSDTLRPGWAPTTLGVIAETRLGKMLSKKAKVGNEPRPYLRNKNVQWGRIDLDDLLAMDFETDELERFAVGSGDLMVCEGGEVGRAAIWRGQLDWIGYQKALHRVRPVAGISSEFLLYAFMWLAQSYALERHVTGSTIKHLPQEDLRELEIPLPPLNEQRRIVAAIEEHLSRLDAADASLASARRRLDALVATELRTALDGAWPRATIGDLAVSVRNGLFVSRPAASPPGVPIFRISAVRPMVLDVTDFRFADVARDQVEQFLTNEDDLLFTRYSGNAEYVGACARVPRMAERALHPDKLIRVVVDRARIEPAFMELACSSGQSREEIRARRKTTAGQVGIAGGQLRTVSVPVPPLDEQRRIVARVEEQLSAIDALRASIERARRRSATLRRAILERAFRGELVPQDPADESAEALLARIRAEREAAHAIIRRRRARK